MGKFNPFYQKNATKYCDISDTTLHPIAGLAIQQDHLLTGSLPPRMTGVMTKQVVPEVVVPAEVVTQHVVGHVEARPEEEIAEGVTIQTLQTIGMMVVGRVSEDTEAEVRTKNLNTRLFCIRNLKDLWSSI